MITSSAIQSAQWAAIELEGSAVVTTATEPRSTRLLDPVDWLILQCLEFGDDTDDLVDDIVDIVGVDRDIAVSRTSIALREFARAGLLTGSAADAPPDPLFDRPLNH